MKESHVAFILHPLPANNCSRCFLALENKQGNNVDNIGSFMIRPVLWIFAMGFPLVKKKRKKKKEKRQNSFSVRHVKNSVLRAKSC